MSQTDKETLGFQSEVKQLLDLMVHSLYSNREVFLRELVSNAADAADKLRFAALAEESLYEGDSSLAITVDYSKELGTITVRDRGIGMTRQEVIDNIGTIARSGTREFVSSLTGDQQKDSQLIGQFGVGFYSSFIVADRVVLSTRKAGHPAEQGVRWESDGSGSYTIETIPRKARGTEVVLHLREDARDLLDGYRLRRIINRYSDHVSVPIQMPVEEEGKSGYETVNTATALWTRPKREIEDKDYIEFYKHVAHDFEEPLLWTHNQVEGKLEYTTLLYVPKRAPFDLWDREARHGVKLYVRRVFIMEGADELLPRYLRFVRGVIDCADLPLNVSRELLQHNKIVDSIRSASVKRLLDALETLARDEPEDYAQFWATFGRVLKEGIVEDPANQEKIAGLLRFASTRAEQETETVSLADYLERMQEHQAHIYYITAASFDAARHSPHLEIFRKHGIEVLLMSDPVDEWLVAHLPEYQGKALKSVTQGDLELGEQASEEAAAAGEPAQEAPAEALTGRIKAALGDAVKEVRFSKRLTRSPACLVADESDLGINLQRVLKAAGQEVPEVAPILEVNPQHLIVRRMAGLEGEAFERWARMLHDQAVLSEGGSLQDPAAFVQQLNDTLAGLLEDDADAA